MKKGETIKFRISIEKKKEMEELLSSITDFIFSAVKRKND